MITRSLLFCIAAFLFANTGCSRLQKTDCQPHHLHRRVILNKAIAVRVGGEVVEPRAIHVEDGNLSLRNAILQAGGLKRVEPPQLLLAQAPAVTHASTSPQITDSDSLSILSPIFSNETEIQKLLGEPDPIFGNRGSYSAPTDSTSTLVKYLQDVSAQMKVGMNRSLPLQTKLDPIKNSPSELIEDLKHAFDELASGNPEFSAKAIAALDLVLARLAPKNESSSPPIASTQQIFGQVPSTRTNVPLMIAIETADDNLMNRSKFFFHPELVFKTAIGDIPLRDGDFVYAIRAEDTSITIQQEYQHESGIPVLGVSNEFVAIDPNEFKKVTSVIQLKRDALGAANLAATLENVCILTRQSGSLGSQTYVFPLTAPNQQDWNVTLGSIAPGDRFLFTDASRSPLIWDRLIETVQERLKDKRATELKNAKCKISLPVDGSYLNKMTANLKYYTKPLVDSTRNIIR